MKKNEETRLMEGVERRKGERREEAFFYVIIYYCIAISNLKAYNCLSYVSTRTI
jgi:hypothetical protein